MVRSLIQPKKQDNRKSSWDGGWIRQESGGLDKIWKKGHKIGVLGTLCQLWLYRPSGPFLKVLKRPYSSVFCKRVDLENLVKFTWKLLCQSLSLQLLLKRDSGTGVFHWILRNFQELLYISWSYYFNF